MSGGFQGWKSAGLDFETPVVLTAEQKQRYSRHLLIPEVGVEGQARLLGSKALLIGAGGLGSPASLYLAAAGVGTIGIVDFDIVDVSNLQRQIVHTTDRVGERKVESARKSINALNPEIKVVAHEEMLVAENVERIIAGYDVILDGTDTFETRYILNDAAVAAGIPVVHASVFRFEGQLTTFVPFEGPCYRCLYPTPPPPELAPGCSVAGVLGVVPGILGMLQANEALKVLLGIGEHAGRPAAPVRCPRDRVHRAQAAARPELPGLLRRGGRRAGGGSSADRRRGRQRRAVRDDDDRPGRQGLAGGARVSTVFIPAVLRSNVGGVKSLELDGGSIRDVVGALVEQHPSLGSQLLTDDGDLNRFVNVYVNGQDVRYLAGLDTPVAPADEVRLLPGDGRRLRRMGHVHDELPRHGGRFENILDAIGYTPLVEIPRMSPNPAVRIFAKLEMFNPTGSVKDRVAEVPDRRSRGARPAPRGLDHPRADVRQHRASRWR